MSEAPVLIFPPGITLANTLGCIELSIILNALFLGVVAMQFLTYWLEQKDGWPTKCLVWYTFILDIAHSMIVTEMLWKYTITKFGDPTAILATQWEYAITPVFMVITVIPIQLFLAWRVKRLSTNSMIGTAVFVLITLMALAHGITAIYLSAYAFNAAITLDGFNVYLKIAIAWSALSFATDTVVMLALIYTLYSRKTGFKTSDGLIMRIIFGTVQTGIPLTVFGIGHLISIKLAATTGIVYIFSIPVGRVYSNTLLTTLNSRARIRSATNTHASDGVNMMDTALAQRINARSGVGNQAPLKIQVSQSQDIRMDELGRGTNGSHEGYKGTAW